MSEERKLAVLIDSDNVSAKYAQFIMQEVVKYGTPTYKRVYGDWEKGGNGWHSPSVNYSIMPVQQTCYVAGKNATDFSMIIDAMDILYTGNVDGFVLVTSDSDFTRLAIRLREAGKLVVGIGELKTPRAFTISCHHFCYLNQVCEPEGMADEKTIRKALLDYVTENSGERLDLAKISAVLTSRFGNIDFAELGYKRFSSFVDSFPEIRRSNTFVTLRKPRTEAPSPAPAGAGEPTEEQLVAAITDYLNTHGAQRDNMMKIESALNAAFGKVDYSRFGSKRFAKFIDRLDGFTRSGTDIAFAAPPRAAKPAVIAEKPAEQTLAITAEQFSSEVVEYARENMPRGGNAGQLNNQFITKYGKSYLSDLGAADFRHAVEGVDGVSVKSNRIYLAAAEQDAPAEVTAEAAEPQPAAAETAHETVNTASLCSAVLGYAYANMPDGGNIGQLNNELISRFGKSYCAELGFDDFKTMLSSVDGVRVRKNFIYLTDSKYSEMVDEQSAAAEEQNIVPEKTTAEAPEAVGEAEEPASAPAPAVEPAEEPAPIEKPAEAESAAPAKKSRSRRGRSKNKRAEQPTEENIGAAEAPEAADTTVTPEITEAPEAEEPEKAAETSPEKPEINAVKRDILFYAAEDGGVSLALLGNLLSAKYGRTYLRELGFSSIKKLVTAMAGVVVKGNRLAIDEDFARRTEEIEQFVNEFARGEGSHSVKALSSSLKKRFEGFDFTDYGFARFTDFINAIDGVKAERYYVKPLEGE
ncbi:MAG: NYN domain-containing protein [Oscillospiraceae bacterium]